MYKSLASGWRPEHIVLEPKEVKPPAFRMSNFGYPDRKLWYLLNATEKQEALRSEVQLKFLYGDILEKMIIPLIQHSGHEVTGIQSRLEIDGLIGHRDLVIDGMVVDIKSANSRAFQKFKSLKDLVNDDPFGYVDQLHLYLMASQDDPLVTYKDEAGWLVIDKELGHLLFTTMKFPQKDFTDEIKRKREMLQSPSPPLRCYPDRSEGVSGNRVLDVQCSYCGFKKHCWPGLRTFLYAHGPKFYTKIFKEPNVLEIT